MVPYTNTFDLSNWSACIGMGEGKRRDDFMKSVKMKWKH